MAGDHELLKYFIDKTDQQLTELKTDVKFLREAAQDQVKHRAGLLAASQLKSTLVSGFLGFITFSATIGTSIYLGRQERQAIIEAAKIEVAHSLKEVRK